MNYRYNSNDQQYKRQDEIDDDPYLSSNYKNLGSETNSSVSNYYNQQRTFGPNKNEFVAKNYNDFLERQGIPTISPEDIQILRECGRESLFYRCFPITAALCAGLVYTASVRQFQPRFYHYLGAVFLGYFAGKISYRSVCEEKLINSRSNSPFVNSIRKRKGLFVGEYEMDINLPESSMESDWTMPSSSSMNKSYGMQEFDDESSPFQQPNKKNYSSFGSHEFSAMPIPEQSMERQDGQSDVTTGLTYDDLRNRNRSLFKNI